MSLSLRLRAACLLPLVALSGLAANGCQGDDASTPLPAVTDAGSDHATIPPSDAATRDSDSDGPKSEAGAAFRVVQGPLAP